MATYQGAQSVYVANAASVGADLIVLTGGGMAVKVTNISGTAPLFWTVDQQGGPCPVPTTSGGSDVHVTGAAVNASTPARHDGQFGSIVQVVSTGNPSYLVEVQGQHSTS